MHREYVKCKIKIAVKKNYKWIIFLITTLGYSLFYVCRLSINVVKRPIVDSGYLSETELGIIGGSLFFSYAVGKFVNGFFADRFNIRFLMSGGLLVAALLNLILGMHVLFGVFVVLWGINGWVQSLGGPCSAIALNRWFGDKQRGTVYGFWSASHNIGEAFTFIFIAFVVSMTGWQFGFLSAGMLGIIGAVLIFIFLKPFPHDAIDGDVFVNRKEIGKKQLSVLKSGTIWLLALSSAFMYISRYAVNSWGVFYLEAQKGYSTLDASFIISISSVCGIVGTVFSGIISDKFFAGSRNVPALIFGLMNVSAICLFLLVPGVHFWVDALAMVLFGLGIGVLICFLGGLMAVDIAPCNASGAALGVVGIASYIGAGLQDVMSGILIEGQKTVQNGVEVYDFTYINWFWIGAALLSVVFALLVWNAGEKRSEIN